MRNDSVAAYMATSNDMADSTTDSISNSTNDSMSDSTANTMSNSTMNSMSDSPTKSMAASMSNSMADSMDSMTVVCHFGHITIMVVGVIVDILGPAVGEQHSVGSLSHPCTVVRLLLAEVGPGEVVIHAVVVGVGNDLTQTTMTS